ncbi:hypothetical protein PIB30_076536 [Stylosanthes scabra]|uniref:Uncharacterized protein n=1 Tax=Stylosanthes scabra TaxID=79078 RepID=A0ABU6ZNW0_9FABA|nr:hypothetical protein [Stylosanthes scabra]
MKMEPWWSGDATVTGQQMSGGSDGGGGRDSEKGIGFVRFWFCQATMLVYEEEEVDRWWLSQSGPDLLNPSRSVTLPLVPRHRSSKPFLIWCLINGKKILSSINRGLIFRITRTKTLFSYSSLSLLG